ncbi:MAG: hypothetical protein A2V67_19350 [Deltaproteobacteria bacterium RBG_13_61_14]|nr:MAG: hypothetical protein A2V67_19350 [Deltaproteobacteria bacterium RBG_13_61_14]
MTAIFRNLRPESTPIAALVAAGLIAILYLATANPEFRFMEGATAIKLLQARALLGGEGYTDIGRIGSPPEIVRPPGFALIIAGVIALFGEDMLVLKVINNSFAPLGFFALFFLFRRRTQDPGLALLMALAAYLFPHLYEIARYLESEVLFCLLFFASLAVFETAHDKSFRDQRLLVLFCFLLAVATLVRTAAFVLVPAAWLTLAFDSKAPRRLRLIWAGVILGTWIVVGGGWMIRTQLVAPKGELTYLTKLLAGEPVNSFYWLAEDHRVPLLPRPPRATAGAVARRCLPNTVFFFRQVLGNLWRASSAWPLPAVLAAVGLPAGLALLGLVLGLFRKRRILDFATVLYLGVILFWPYQDHRFLLPIAPFLLLYLIEGFQAGARFVFRVSSEPTWPRARFAILAVLVLLIGLFTARDLQRLAEGKRLTTPVLEWRPHFRITSPNLGAYHSLLLLDWIRTHSSPSDRVLFHSYEPCALITERQCSPIPPVPPERLIRYLDEQQITLVVVDDEVEYGRSLMSAFTAHFLLPAIEAYPGRFQTVYSLSLPDSSARVLRVAR